MTHVHKELVGKPRLLPLSANDRCQAECEIPTGTTLPGLSQPRWRVESRANVEVLFRRHLPACLFGEHVLPPSSMSCCQPKRRYPLADTAPMHVGIAVTCTPTVKAGTSALRPWGQIVSGRETSNLMRFGRHFGTYTSLDVDPCEPYLV